MSCKCLSLLEKQIIKSGTKSHPNKKVIDVDIEQSTIFNFKSGKDRQGTKSKVSIRLDGIKRPVSTFIIHQYCPFCGKKHDKS